VTAAPSSRVSAQRLPIAVQRLRALADNDETLRRLLRELAVSHQQGRSETGAVLDAARSDEEPAGDTPLGRREFNRRMVGRLRDQHGHISRSRGHASALTAALRRHSYRHRASGPGERSDIGAEGRPAVIAAIRRALDIKGIHDPVARGRWERGMGLVAMRESGGQDVENDWDSNAKMGTPSKGPWQFIEPTFERYHEPGTPRNIHNFVSQAAAFVNYAQKHYGVAADGSNLAERIQQADPRRPPKGY
jgi:SLT domain-containing protein